MERRQIQIRTIQSIQNTETIKKMITQDEINTVFADLKEAHVKYRKKTLEFTAAKYKVKRMKSQAIASGKVEGKNAAEREANMNVMFKEALADRDTREDAMYEARHELTLAELEQKRVGYSLRLVELMQ